MKKITLTERTINRIIKKVILEMDEESFDLTTINEWDNIWFKLRKIHTSFGFPENDGVYSFGGLFFFYDETDGCLKLPSQDPYDWRRTKEEGIEVLERYYDRLTNIFEESDLGLSIDMGRDYSMIICKN
jgi:hypothetical protein